MKNKKSVSVIYYIAAVCFYIAAILNFVHNHTSTGVMMMCLGSSQLCLGSVWLGKSRKDENGPKC